MRNIRRAYYDWFSRFYDRFVAAHSSDAQGAARAISILKHEREILGFHFGRVEKLVTPTGHSKVWVCRG